MSKGLNLPLAAYDLSLYHGFVDHFHRKDTTFWTTTSADAGTAAVGDAAGGIITLTSGDGTPVDNDECYLSTTAEVFLFAAGKPLHFRARTQLTQAATNAANCIAGVVNGVAADLLVDNGGGPKTTAYGAFFYAKDGSLNWFVGFSNSTTQNLAELTATNSLTKSAKVVATTAYQLLEIDVIPKTATTCDVIFKIDGSTVYKMMDQTFTSTPGTTEMSAVLGVKAGTGVNQTFLADAVACFQKI